MSTVNEARFEKINKHANKGSGLTSAADCQDRSILHTEVIGDYSSNQHFGIACKCYTCIA